MKAFTTCLTLLIAVAVASALTPLSVTGDSESNSEPSLTANWRGVSITEFDDPGSEGFNWEIVNDGVMGGLSKGSLDFNEDGTLRFSGNLSLKNNGGFSTMRSGDLAFDLSNDLGLLLRIKGDGRTYDARLATDAKFRGMEVTFSAKVETSEGKWTVVKVPFADFKGGFRGMDLPNEKFDPAKIRRIGLLLGDKVEGPFEIEVDWIRTYGKGQGRGSMEAKSLTDAEKAPSDSSATLVDAVLADDRFTTLATALGKAELLEVFQGKDPLTVFAPTDEAFAKLPAKALAELLKPEERDQLVAVLSYHVSAGSNRLADALRVGKVPTLQGEALQVSFRDGAVRVNDASLLDADVICSNGVIHVIDSVLLPPPPEKPQRQTLLTTAKAAGGFATLLAAVSSAELDAVLDGEGPFTLFAPTDKAFAALPKGTVDALLKKENRKMLVATLSNHVVSGRVSAGDALNAGKAKSLEGSALEFGIEDGLFKVNGATVTTADIDAGNGVIHVIDRVLQPQQNGNESDQTRRSSNSTKSEKTATTNAGAFDLIAAAIETGVPLYNNGDPAGCAKVYQQCIEELSENKAVDSHVQRMLEVVMKRAKQHDSAVERAWLFRATLDGMLAYLEWSSTKS